jgi:hypothetical protein
MPLYRPVAVADHFDRRSGRVAHHGRNGLSHLAAPIRRQAILLVGYRRDRAALVTLAVNTVLGWITDFIRAAIVRRLVPPSQH